MVLHSPQDCDSKRIVGVKVYQPKLAIVGRRQVLRWYNVVFGAALFLQTLYMLTTMGEPYHEFLAKADREGFQGKFLAGGVRLVDCDKLPLVTH